MSKSLIFDLDGTLWDASQIYMEAWNLTMQKQKLDVQFNRSQFVQLIGIEINQVLDQYFPGMTVSQRNALVKKVELQQNLLFSSHQVRIYPGIEKYLPLLAKKYTLYMVSNCSSEVLQQFKDQSGLATHFEDFRVFGDNQKSKSENIMDLADQYQLKRPVYIGDKRHDWLACQKARVEFIQVTYGFDPPIEEVLGFDNFQDLARHLLEVD
ncbi:MAG: HAD family hydrolase [Candidatus Cyclobacteriaceae bacterium M3_2C_046]